MRAFSYYWPRDNDGGHTIRSAIPKPMLHANITAVCFVVRELLPREVLRWGNGNFQPFWSCNRRTDRED